MFDFDYVLNRARTTESFDEIADLFKQYLDYDWRHALAPRFVHYFRLASWEDNWLMYHVLLSYPQAKQCLSIALAFTSVCTQECWCHSDGLDMIWFLCEKGATIDYNYKYDRGSLQSLTWKKRIVKTCARVRASAMALCGALKRRGLDRHVAALVARKVWNARREWHMCGRESAAKK
jgi:hypothetical protein